MAGAATEEPELRSDRDRRGERENLTDYNSAIETENGISEAWKTPGASPKQKKRGRLTNADRREKNSGQAQTLESLWKRKRQEEQGHGDDEDSEDQTPTKTATKKYKIRKTPESGKVNRDDGEHQAEGLKTTKGITKALEEITKGMNQMVTELKILRDEANVSRNEAREDKERLINLIEIVKNQGENERRRLEERIQRLENNIAEKDNLHREHWERMKKEVAEEARITAEEVDNERRTESRELEGMIREVGRKIEAKDRQERRNNIVIKGQDLPTGGNAAEVASEIIERITRKKIGIRETIDMRGAQGKAILVKVQSWEEKRKIMGQKRHLAEEKIFIDDDLTDKERDIQRRILERARVEKEKGRRTKVGYKKILIEETQWEWNEETESLVERRSTRANEQNRRGGDRGIREKDEDFWEYLEEFDIIGLTETWLEEKEWTSWEKRLPKTWKWRCQGADRQEKKGRARGGIITGVKYGLEEDGIILRGEGIQEVRIRREDEIWRVITFYNRGGAKEKLKELEETVGEEREEENLIIGGDFNARIGERGGRDNFEDPTETGKRRAKDKKENKEGKELMKVIEDRGWSILNGNKEDAEEGEWKFHKGPKRTTIDYGISNERTWEKINSFKIGCRTESDHQPIIVTIGSNRKPAKNEKTKEGMYIQVWDEKEAKAFKERMETVNWAASGVEEEWTELQKEVEKATSTRIRKPGNKTGYKAWWDRECKEMKIELRKEWRKAREGKEEDEQAFKAKRGIYKKKCEEKRLQWTRNEEKELEGIKDESEA
ncbi:golgin subfamily A member 6-like protein 22 [Diprion similis]|uniref:golgin subfamily A member 6-like protein 22 n=1 Tax=Diprion similis TaxID=362088 RepID=UPI001EF92A7B|nr:golgin subfamily A member 6-like protein 22 [Diprion similis]